MQPLFSRFADAAAVPRVELVLAGADGAPWRLAMSAGMERFVGRYPLLATIAPDGAWLRYEAAGPMS